MAVVAFTSDALLLKTSGSAPPPVTECRGLDSSIDRGVNFLSMSCFAQRRLNVAANSFGTSGGGCNNCCLQSMIYSSPNSRYHSTSGSYSSVGSLSSVSNFSESQFRSKQLRRATASQVPGVRCAAGATASPEIASSTSNLYGLLGLTQDVGLPEIKSAFRKMALKYHPDVCTPTTREVCTKMFLEVQHAYEVLSDPELRADYDYALMHPSFAQAFERSGGRLHRRAGSHRRRDNGVSEAWKLQWEAQLTRLKQRKREKRETANPFANESWGFRMRRQTQQTAAAVA